MSYLKQAILDSRMARRYAKAGKKKQALSRYQDAINFYQDAIGNMPASYAGSPRVRKIERVIALTRHEMHSLQRKKASRKVFGRKKRGKKTRTRRQPLRPIR